MAFQLQNFTDKGYTYPEAYARIEIPSIWRRKPNPFANIRLSIFANKVASDAGAEPLVGRTIVIEGADYDTFFTVIPGVATAAAQLLMAQSYAAISGRAELSDLLAGATNV